MRRLITFCDLFPHQQFQDYKRERIQNIHFLEDLQETIEILSCSSWYGIAGSPKHVSVYFRECKTCLN